MCASNNVIHHQNFSCLSRIELIKPAMELYRHNLTGTLEASVRATNTQYDDNDILQHLDVRILEVKMIHIEWTTFMTLSIAFSW